MDIPVYCIFRLGNDSFKVSECWRLNACPHETRNGRNDFKPQANWNSWNWYKVEPLLFIHGVILGPRKKNAISLNFHWKEYVSSLEMAEHKMGFHWAPNIYRADLVGSIGSTAQEMDRIKQTYSQERDAKKGCGYTLVYPKWYMA